MGCENPTRRVSCGCESVAKLLSRSRKSDLQRSSRSILIGSSVRTGTIGEIGTVGHGFPSARKPSNGTTDVGALTPVTNTRSTSRPRRIVPSSAEGCSRKKAPPNNKECLFIYRMVPSDKILIHLGPELPRRWMHHPRTLGWRYEPHTPLVDCSSTPENGSRRGRCGSRVGNRPRERG